ncbi:MAG: response regulator [Pseudomonadota bacterium]|nr:response regulator [Pseudomonadota bacterium]
MDERLIRVVHAAVTPLGPVIQGRQGEQRIADSLREKEALLKGVADRPTTMGMQVVRTLVRQLDGRLEINGDSGTTCRVDRSVAGGMSVILIVEDMPLIRLALSELLQDAGFPVTEAKDGAEALAAFAPDIAAVLLDIRLPDADGLDLLRAFKARRPDCPIVMMTGHGFESIEAEARLHGADDFLHKPFEIEAMIALVQRLVPRPA